MAALSTLASVFSNLGRLVDREPCIILWQTWYERLRQRHRLAVLDNRMLDDLGLSREDVARECGKPFWRK